MEGPVAGQVKLPESARRWSSPALGAELAVVRASQIPDAPESAELRRKTVVSHHMGLNLRLQLGHVLATGHQVGNFFAALPPLRKSAAFAPRMSTAK